MRRPRQATSLLWLGVGASVLLACSGAKDPSLAQEETPGDALFLLAQDFRAKGNDEAAKLALRFLVQHYPSDPRAVQARAALAEPSSSHP